MNWQAAVERTVMALGYDLVDVERSAGGLLRVYIDRRVGQAYPTPGDTVTVGDCETVTRQLQYALEVDHLDYQRLEVSSPGLDRPLKRPQDWVRFAGLEVEVALRVPFQGRRRWKGLLRSGDEGGWRLELPAETVLDFKLDEVHEARLVPVVDFKKRRAPKVVEGASDVGGDQR
ncbi:MAG: ribosome maturation factor RimP [Aquabacterium sp.]